MVWQLNSTVDQMVAAGQTLYITLVGLEQQAADGQRSLAALDRSLEELRLRRDWARSPTSRWPRWSSGLSLWTPRSWWRAGTLGDQ